ncbi:MAG: hypothetical protein ACRBN8_10700 [Nannocystales bacterium]
MSLFGIGPMEMVVVAVVALMLFNPRELPKMLRSMAKFWGQLRATADEFKDTIMTADGVDEIQELVKGTKGQIRQVETDARRELMKARAEMRKAQQKLLKANQAKLEKQTRERDAEKAEPAAGSSDDSAAAGGDSAEEGGEGQEHDDGPVSAQPPHERRASSTSSEASAETEADGPVAATPPHQAKRPSVPKPPATSRDESSGAEAAKPSSTGGADDDAHNQGAA